MHVVATGSSALRLASGPKESLAGRFERLTLSHWSASALAEAFDVARDEAAQFVVRMGSYPGAFQFRDDLPRWMAYVRDAIVEPAIGRCSRMPTSSLRSPSMPLDSAANARRPRSSSR